jgi:2-keto-4-pentenoate hydratase/2-oxohepta-3-ene-1,7-dioic acid hydratase in catechol pathway
MMVTADEVGNVDELAIATRVNGETVQQASLADLIFTIPVIIEYLSGFTALSPGDVIATGTPGGVGDRRDPPRYLKDGDVVEVEISKLGILRNTVRDET